MFIIKNWKDYQHYKDRNPPWIKLHFSILSSQDWVMLDDNSKLLAVVCMLLASRKEGQIDGSEDGLAYLQRVAYLKKRPDLNPLIKCGFLEYASGCKQLQANDRPEKSREYTSTETDPRDLEIANKMFSMIRDNLNRNQKEPNFKTWADTIRLMRERDNHTHEEIESLFAWANSDDFWKTNILSPEKLRKQWDTLMIKRGNSKQKSSVPYWKQEKELEAWASAHGIRALPHDTYRTLYDKCIEHEKANR